MILEPGLGFAFASGALALGLRLIGRHDAGTTWDRRVGGIAWVAVGTWATMQWATMWVPVVSDMRAAQAARGPGWAEFDVSAFKGRKDCTFEYVQARVYSESGAEDGAFWERLEDPTPGQSRGGGAQSMGRWRIKFSEAQRQKAVRFFSHHYCGNLWGRTVTESPPFPLSP